MKRLFWVFLIGMFSIACLTSAGIGDRYVSRNTQDGTIYFIEPKSLGVKDNILSFTYDMTLLSWTDSVTVNFTIVSKRMEVPEGLAIRNSQYDFACRSYSPMFIDIVKKGFEVRVTSKFPLKEIEQIFKSEEPPVFSFTQAGVAESAGYSRSAWKKERVKLQNIMSVYKYRK